MPRTAGVLGFCRFQHPIWPLILGVVLFVLVNRLTEAADPVLTGAYRELTRPVFVLVNRLTELLTHESALAVSGVNRFGVSSCRSAAWVSTSSHSRFTPLLVARWRGLLVT